MIVTYTNAFNESIGISDTGTFRLIDIQGLGMVEGEVQTTKAPYQDGSTRVDTLLQERIIELELGIFAENEEQLFNHRRLISRIFNPKMANGVLKVEYATGIREIKCTPESTVDFPTGADNSTDKFQRVFISLICPNPYWLSIQAQTKPMANWLGGLSFPIRFRRRNIKFATRGTRIMLENDGDVSAPLIIEFKGEAVNPVITNKTTGEYIKVNRNLSITDKLIIDTSFGNKRVEIEDAEGNRTNVFNWLDLNSTFFQLESGITEIEYGSDTGVEFSTVELIWQNRYLGI